MTDHVRIALSYNVKPENEESLAKDMAKALRAYADQIERSGKVMVGLQAISVGADTPGMSRMLGMIETTRKNILDID